MRGIVDLALLLRSFVTSVPEAPQTAVATNVSYFDPLPPTATDQD